MQNLLAGLLLIFVAAVAATQGAHLSVGTLRHIGPGMIPLTLIEVQVGSYLGEDDIVRIEDTYGRA